MHQDIDTDANVVTPAVKEQENQGTHEMLQECGLKILPDGWVTE